MLDYLTSSPIGPRRSAPFVHPCRPGAPIPSAPPAFHWGSPSSLPACPPPSRRPTQSVVVIRGQLTAQPHSDLFQQPSSFRSMPPSSLLFILPSPLCTPHRPADSSPSRPLTNHAPTTQAAHISCQPQPSGALVLPVLQSSSLQPISASYLQELQPTHRHLSLGVPVLCISN